MEIADTQAVYMNMTLCFGKDQCDPLRSRVETGGELYHVTRGVQGQQHVYRASLLSENLPHLCKGRYLRWLRGLLIRINIDVSAAASTMTMTTSRTVI